MDADQRDFGGRGAEGEREKNGTRVNADELVLSL